MEEEEKAREIYDKMCYILMVDGGSLHDEAKQCALLTIDEIFHVLPDIQELWDYWNQVKQEVIKI